MTLEAAVPPPPAAARWPWRSLPWVGGLFIAVIVASAAMDIVRSRQAAITETGRELDSLARVVAEQTERSVQTVDRVLGHVVDEYRSGSLAGLKADELNLYLKDQAVGLVQIEGLSMVDAAGSVHATSSPDPLPDPRPSIANLGVFKALQQNPRLGLVVTGASPAVVRPRTWVFRMLRRLDGANGEFRGLVAAGGKVDYFQQFYRDVRLDAGTQITLMHRNATLVARHPPAESALGQRYPLFDEMLAQRDAGLPLPARFVSPIDGVERFGTVALVSGYPLGVVVTRDVDVALAPWRQQSVGTVVRTLALALLALFLLGMVRRQFARLDKARASLELSRERFALAAAGSDDGIWDWDVTGDRIFASARAREIFGVPDGPDLRTRERWFAAIRIHPDDVEPRREAIHAHLSGQTPHYVGEYRVLHADGRYRWVRVRGQCVRNASGAPTRMAGSVSDIDSRKRSEDELRLSEERYALAMTGSTGGHWVWEIGTDELFVSGTVNQLFGLPADTEPGTRAAYFGRVKVHPEDLAKIEQINDEVLCGRASRLDFEYRIVLPDGEREDGAVRWILSRAQCFRDAEGKAVRMAGISVDISDRKRTEQALRLSEERFALAVAGSNDGIVDWDIVGDRMYTSERTMEILGVDATETVRTRAEWLALLQLHPDDQQRHADELRRFLESDAPLRAGEYRVRRADGEYRWVRLRNLCVRDAAGRPLRLAGSVSDIDAYKRVEAALRESEERYALAMTGSNEGHWVWDMPGRQIFVSAKLAELFALPGGAQVIGDQAYFDSIPLHPEDRERVHRNRADHVAGLTPRLDHEFRIVLPDSGDVRWMHTRAQCFRDADGRPLRLAGSTVDVTQRKGAEQALRLSEERFALAVAGSDSGVWDIDYSTGMVFYSRRGREIAGLALEPEVQPFDEWEASLQLHPDDVAQRQKALHDHLAGTAPSYIGEWRMRQPDGSWRWVRVHGMSVRDAAGAPVRMTGSITDIDARRRAEDSLRQSQERFALAVGGSDDGVWDFDFTTRMVFNSRRGRQITGMPLEPEVQTMEEWFEQLQLHPDDAPRRLEAMEAHLSGRAPAYVGEWRIRQPDGSYRWVRVHGMCTRDAHGKPLRMAGSVTDIDARKRAEESLRQSEERFALAVAGSDDGVWDFDYAANRAFGSRRARQLSGLPLEPEVQPLDEYFAAIPVHPDDQPMRRAAMQAVLDGLAPAYEGEWRCRQTDGVYRWIRVRGICVRDAAGKLLRMAGSVSDIDARKRAEESLRHSEERYALAVAGSDDGVWDWDFTHGLAFESARARELQGLPPGPELQPLGTLLESLRVHPEDEPRRAEGIRAHLAGETVAYECEYRVRHDDGQYRWIRVRALCIRDAQDKPCRMAGSVSDIDARKRAEEALRQSEERFSLAVAGANDGILDWDIVHDSMYVSERAMRLVGLTRDAGLYTRAEWAALVMPRFHPDDTQRLADELRGDARNPSDAHEGEYRVLAADGVYRWVRFRGRSVRDADGTAIRWAGSVSDVDGLKRTEEALRRSQERYALAVAGSNEGLWDWDLASDSLFLSPRAQEIVGLAPGEPQRPRREWIALANYHPDDRDLVRNAISAHLRGATPHYRVEYRLQHHSGEWRWYRQRGIAVRDAQGRPTRMAGSMEDITDRKSAEAQRERLEGQLRQAQKLEAIGTLAGGIAHDFNNILAAILGYGEMAQRDAAEGTALRRHIDAALSAGMRAKSLVERILAFSRSGMAERVPVHVASVVGEALDVVAASLPAGVVLERRIDAGDAAIMGDPTQVHQVVMNLCANAVQAIKDQGTLTVTLELAGQGGARCATSVLAETNHVRLCVADTGAGIAPQVLERIFDPFFTTKEVGVGTGLGLSLVHGIVTDLGGGIEVESRVGEGSTFTVYLPWQHCVPVPEAEPAAQASAPNGNGEIILLVDDEEPLVRLGEEMIAELGYEPVGFTSSLRALETFRAEPQRFNAVLSDEAMPEMTGSELVREIMKIRPDIPVVMMSGYVTSALAARARETGVVEVLAKPLVSRDIARGLANALRR
jgi:PAS domain S-box-containing protein